MATLNLYTPIEVSQQIALRVKEKRLSLNLSQQSLAVRSGVSLGALKKFEQSGQISLTSLLKLALVLESLDDFETVFKTKPQESFLTINQSLQVKKRRRGRQ